MSSSILNVFNMIAKRLELETECYSGHVSLHESLQNLCSAQARLLGRSQATIVDMFNCSWNPGRSITRQFLVSPSEWWDNRGLHCSLTKATLYVPLRCFNRALHDTWVRFLSNRNALELWVRTKTYMLSGTQRRGACCCQIQDVLVPPPLHD